MPQTRLPRRKRRRSLFASLLLLTSAIPAQETQLRVLTELVLVPVSVKDGDGRLATGLTQGAFTVKEAGRTQTVSSFSIEPVPLSAAILIDTGISEIALTTVKESFPALTAAFAASDEIAVYRFDRYVEKVFDFTNDPAQVKRGLDKLKDFTPSSSSTGGGPFNNPGPVINGVPVIPAPQAAGRSVGQPTKVLHDAIFETAQELAAREGERRRIILVVSDGQDRNSELSFDNARDNLLRRDVQVFAVGVDSSLLQRLRSTLAAYAEATGGAACFPQSRGAIEACYSQSTEEARYQYVLGYVSSNPRPASNPVFREIEVEVAGRGLEVRHRTGYYQTP